MDICCGTGSILIPLTKMGYITAGIDISSEMLAAASNKAFEAGVEIDFKMQNAISFRPSMNTDVFLCLLDSINHFTKIEELKRLFKNTYKNLNEKGVFIFDINTQYKFENILDKEVFYQVDDEINYIWENKYSKKTRICKFDLTFFVKEGTLYKRIDETVRERCYEEKEIIDLLLNIGYKKIKTYDGFTKKMPNIKSERIFFVAQK